jgi:outer membrane immunogenic protein
VNKLTIYSAVAAALVATPAVAADMAVKAPPPTSPKPAPSWTGFYIGGNVDAVIQQVSGTSDFLQPGDPGGASNPQANNPTSTNAIGGVQFGYNWQFDPRWLVGIEGDWDFTHTRYSFCRQTDTLSVACFDNNNGFETIGSNTDWLATLRGRFGFVNSSNILLYVTGGVAWGRVNTNLAQSCLVDGCGDSIIKLAASNSSATDKAGWVAGLGAAIPIDRNWSARLEWLHIDLGTITSTFTTPGVINGHGATTSTTVWSRNERYDVLRVGLDYRFGAP